MPIRMHPHRIPGGADRVSCVLRNNGCIFLYNHMQATYATKEQVVQLGTRLERQVRQLAVSVQSVEFDDVKFLFHCHSITTELNRRLRNPMAEWDDGTNLFLRKMEKCWNKLPAFHGQVWRGINESRMSEGWFESLTTPNGRGYTDSAFTCTSKDIGIAMRFACELDDETNIYSGKPVLLRIQQEMGRYIAPFVADCFKDEEEVLLPPNINLRFIRWQEQVYTLPNDQTIGVKVVDLEQP